MNPIPLQALNQDKELTKASYERPAVTTFGTVAKLTMTGGSENLKDSTMATRKHSSA